MPVVKLVTPSINVKIRKSDSSGALIPPATEGITIGSVSSSSINRLDNLLDVVEGTPSNGDTLVYNAADDKYYVQTLDLDGGSF